MYVAFNTFCYLQSLKILLKAEKKLKKSFQSQKHNNLKAFPKNLDFRGEFEKNPPTFDL